MAVSGRVPLLALIHAQAGWHVVCQPGL